MQGVKSTTCRWCGEPESEERGKLYQGIHYLECRRAEDRLRPSPFAKGGHRGPPRATICRYCKKGGDLISGAHKACKNLYLRDKARVKNGYVKPGSCTLCPRQLTGCERKYCEDCRRKVNQKLRTLWRSRKRSNSRKECLCGCKKPVEAGSKSRYTMECRITGDQKRSDARVKAISDARAKEMAKLEAKPTLKPSKVIYAKEKPAVIPSNKKEPPKKYVVITPSNVTVTRLDPIGVAGSDFRGYMNS
jgi:hypothetical protein